MKNAFTFKWALVMVLALGAHAGATTIRYLGDLPSGGRAEVATAVSADGSVVVGYGRLTGDADSEIQAFRWTVETGTVALDGGPFGSPSFPAFAWDVSADGAVIIGEAHGGAFRWTEAGGVQLLPEVRGLAIATSGDGSVVVGAPGFRWSVESEHIIWPGAIARDVSRDGSVVVGDLDGEAFRWTESSGMQFIGRGIANAVSSDGSVVVGERPIPGIGWEVFRWTHEAGMIGLGMLPGTAESRADAISSDGSFILGRSGGAFIWHEDHGMRLLADVLMDRGVNISASTRLIDTRGISDDLRTIVGSASFGAFVVQLSHPIPEPANEGLLCAGILMLILLFRRVSYATS